MGLYRSGGGEPSPREPARQDSSLRPWRPGPQPPSPLGFHKSLHLLLSALIQLFLDLRVSGSVSLSPKVFPWAHMLHPTLPFQEACRPWPQGEEVCLGTQLTPCETVTSLASQGKLREASVPMATLLRCGAGHVPAKVRAQCRSQAPPPPWQHAGH